MPWVTPVDPWVRPQGHPSPSGGTRTCHFQPKVTPGSPRVAHRHLGGPWTQRAPTQRCPPTCLRATWIPPKGTPRSLPGPQRRGGRWCCRCGRRTPRRHRWAPPHKNAGPGGGKRGVTAGGWGVPGGTWGFPGGCWGDLRIFWGHQGYTAGSRGYWDTQG